MCLAVPGQIVSINEDDAICRMAKVSFGGVVREASLAYVQEAQVGDYVIVHAGMALSVLDEDEAAETLRYLEEIAAALADGGGER